MARRATTSCRPVYRHGFANAKRPEARTGELTRNEVEREKDSNPIHVGRDDQLPRGLAMTTLAYAASKVTVLLLLRCLRIVCSRAIVFPVRE